MKRPLVRAIPLLLLISLIVAIATCLDEQQLQQEQEQEQEQQKEEVVISKENDNDNNKITIDDKGNNNEINSNNNEIINSENADNINFNTASSGSSDESIKMDDNKTEEDEDVVTTSKEEEPTQVGPFIDLLGPKLFSFERESTDDTKVRIMTHYTNDVVKDTDVIGLYFSADWCGPCREFTPELVNYYKRITQKRKKKFKIIWISRCRSYETYIQFFISKFDASWYALPLEDASGVIGQTLSNLYKVKGIPSLVFLDDVGNIITTDARTMIPNDKAGIGFPYRNPIVTLYQNVIPKSLRLLVRNYIVNFKKQVSNVLLKKKKAKVFDMVNKNKKQIQV